MSVKALVFDCDQTFNEDRVNLVEISGETPAPFRRRERVKPRPVSIERKRGRVRRPLQRRRQGKIQDRRQRDKRRRTSDQSADQNFTRPHGASPMVTVRFAVRANTPGRYMSSTTTPGAANLPGVTARAT